MNWLKRLIKRILGVDIIKVFSLNAISTLVRMLAGMISVKVVAVIIGPAGIALLGQLNNFNTILLGLANGGINNGITKYVAEYKEDKTYIKSLLSNSLKIVLFCSILIGIVLIFGSGLISQKILLSSEYFYVFIIFGFTIIIYALNSLLIAVLNGFKQFKKYVIVNITGTLLGLVYSITLVMTFGLQGALINAVTFQSVMFFVTLWLLRKEPWLKREYFKVKLDKVVVKKYLGFSAMSLTSLILVPVSQLFLRGYIITEISPIEAGVWEGLHRVSNLYLSVITTAFAVYYLPRISEIHDKLALRNEVFRCYKIIIPMLIGISLAVFLLRYVIISILFTPEFIGMADLFSWQLTADFIKMCSWLLSFIMVAKAKTKAFISYEIIFTISYSIICYLMIRVNGTLGFIQGYLINYSLYLIALVVYFRNIIIAHPKRV